MKKLLLAGMLLLSTMLIGAESAKGNEKIEGTVNVKAKVIKFLKITTSDVDFGIIVPGETKKEEKSGEIKLEGSGYVHIQIKDSTGEWVGHKELFKKKEYTVKLTEETSKSVMESKLTLTGKDFLDHSWINDGYFFGNNEVRTFTVSGELTAGPNQEPGNYNGVLQVRAFYN